MFWLFNFMVLFSQNAFARSLKATADKLGQETLKIGFSIAIFGLGLGAIFLILGKQDAGQKITAGMLGILLLAILPNITTMIKGLA